MGDDDGREVEDLGEPVQGVPCHPNIFEPAPDADWQDYVKRLDTLEKQHRHLVAHDDVFWQLTAVMSGNPTVASTGGYFHGVVREMYARSLLVGLRALVDRTSGADSLYRLLADMAHDRRGITLARAGAQWGLERADDVWSFALGAGQRVLTPKLILADQQVLAAAVEPVRDYANATVAHLTRSVVPTPPEVRQVRAALVECFRIIWRYTLLLTGAEIAHPVPIVAQDWTSIFWEPWLAEGADLPEHRTLDHMVAAARKEWTP